MTTINNLTIEQMLEILEDAPEGAEYIDLKHEEGQVYIALEGYQFIEFDGEDWLETDYTICCPYQFQILSLNDLRTAIAEHDEQIKCWSCNKYMTKSQHSANDGFCIHCGNEVDLGCNHNFEDVTIYGDSHKTYQCTICEFRDEEAERHG
ncbi:hypothetical protein ACG9ZL_16435 [Acinetobacter sp. ULE_I057]|uniref:hypothetical protein n=1 Tax=Acinetobacter sp. ULE_I057 TaxID=3373070 RepID=UPI003AF50C16